MPALKASPGIHKAAQRRCLDSNTGVPPARYADRMDKALYLITDRDLLINLTEFHLGFQPPAVILEGLTEEQATAKPQGSPHSISDIVGHMCFWQEYFNKMATEGFRDFPAHAPDGWPKMRVGGWDALSKRFLASVQATRELAGTSNRLDEKLLPEGSPLPFMQRDSVGSGLLHAVIHTSHHLGQVVTLRQILKLWPPPSGSMTW